MALPSKRCIRRLGCSTMDGLLQGGLSGISEIAGEAGCGKTQIVLRMLLASAMDNRHGYSVYVCTEGIAATRRLKQMAVAWLRNTHEAWNADELLQRILIREINEASELTMTIESVLPKLFMRCEARKTPIKLVVIDSIAAVFRADFSNNKMEMLSRSKILYSLSSVMKALCHKFKCPFVITNQVSTWNGCTIPALGFMWTTCLNTRIFLTRNEDTRTLKVHFCPHLPDCSVDYIVTELGVCSCKLMCSSMF